MTAKDKAVSFIVGNVVFLLVLIVVLTADNWAIRVFAMWIGGPLLVVLILFLLLGKET